MLKKIATLKKCYKMKILFKKHMIHGKKVDTTFIKKPGIVPQKNIFVLVNVRKMQQLINTN